ncbi:hypothetical protein CVT24_010206 [Panaeolus cyanescens]|uniref:TauD/TfdA-like domain-containing protein n=1 Tax=Panaeolus cyanescens TaxID=181874 RepID=A0A409YPS8_9AGAR|nr:hypothetical protein CVT24_010206 [Panaeolus cyanescens]
MALPDFSGSLSNYAHHDLTRHIGTIFPDKSVQLSQLLSEGNSDILLRDLATLVSHRGVVFFKDQDLTIEQQKQLVSKLGELTGKPATSGLHRHPLTPDDSPLGTEVTVISSASNRSVSLADKPTRASNGWHTDITFEPVPSDYAILKIHTLPTAGGDTLIALILHCSGYEAYDRLSTAYKKFLEGLNAVHSGEVFHAYANLRGYEIPAGPRGAPLNVGKELKATHPVIRTNPVTGYKSLFVNKTFTKRIVELTSEESEETLNFLARHVSENHDLQVRYRWEKNDIAIWDNRSTFHTATGDYEELRVGDRAVSLGEQPFYNPASKSRRADLGLSR